MPEEPEPRQLSLGEIVWRGLLRDAELPEDELPFVGLVTTEEYGRLWENVDTGDFL